ncbi:Flagellar basal-body rod protein [Alloalcanivorax dieselolei B5]|uniref:Flagellar basal body rod protein FlgB n=1 Tax=Alcanivorax dieselolei (strain DSM 16502 / CGMCC 1.3690 / MCCC 1A00001 / B-5) TaxID=930169 RepID=K0CGG4_ALCDB|nr:flagellar basal body rod protein FlgB [Alloalcanivorax dieselolei]AFT71703.1 Flagellar basal-body rod protein [Alloalcanivorax dieselolei B5]GGJ88660.1 flagellar basal body rod protein FlgB [Alloalcanivorax dieselolei]
MIDKLAGALNFYQQALQLRHERQGVLAGNIANADTPHFKARDFNFSDELARAVAGDEQERALHLTTTSERHLATGVSTEEVDLLYRVPDQPSLDGNTVNMDVERVQFADNSVRYQAALTMINSRIQGLKGAMQSE